MWWREFETYFVRFIDLGVLEMIFDVSIGKKDEACLADVKKDGLSELSKHVDLKYQLLLEHVRKRDARD